MSGLQLRWHYYDPTTYDYDWYAQIDEAGLNCVPNPVIDVNPDSFSSSQVPAEIQAQILNISNLGSGDLIWNIDEDSASVPDLFTQLPVTDNEGILDETDPTKLEADNFAPPRSAPESRGRSPAVSRAA